MSPFTISLALHRGRSSPTLGVEGVAVFTENLGVIENEMAGKLEVQACLWTYAKTELNTSKWKDVGNYAKYLSNVQKVRHGNFL